MDMCKDIWFGGWLRGKNKRFGSSLEKFYSTLNLDDFWSDEMLGKIMLGKLEDSIMNLHVVFDERYHLTWV